MSTVNNFDDDDIYSMTLQTFENSCGGCYFLLLRTLLNCLDELLIKNDDIIATPRQLLAAGYTLCIEL